ncbi:MAG TPA: hypothetical protein VHW05_08255 [Phenylobacterium sp.]|jgi:hypothetical protein|nr:hypothetical protein [Phenylobacterium sp.]
MDLSKSWQTLSEGQGSVVSALITVVAAIVGVFLGWLLFSGRVKNLETALQASEESIQKHLHAVEHALTAHGATINDQLLGFSQQLVNIGSAVADIPTSPPEHIAPEEQRAQDTLRDDWIRIRDRLEAIASDPQVDGRTRAKYARLDRRRYIDLVNALEQDGKDVAGFRSAVELWQRFRTGRAIPAPADIARMRELADRLALVAVGLVDRETPSGVSAERASQT